MIKLGSKVRDTITGFQGIAIARTQWMYGCERITIKPDKVDKDGKTIEAETFDEPQVVLVRAEATRPDPERSGRGGPRPEPTREPQ